MKTCKKGCCSLNIIEMIRSIQNCLNGKIESDAKGIGLNAMQLMMIYEIFENPGMTLNDLCQRLELPKSSVSRIVDGLVVKGIVVREIPMENRRVIKLSIADDFTARKDLEGAKASLVGDLDQEKTERIMNALQELKSAIKDE